MSTSCDSGFTNGLTRVSVVFDDERRRIPHVSVIDHETNATYGEDVTLEKVVERRQPRRARPSSPTFSAPRRGASPRSAAR